MTPVESRPNDTKLVFAIAGLVVFGTAGIALLAGWSSSGDEQTTPAPTARTRPAPAPLPAMPAAHTRTVPTRVEPEVIVEPVAAIVATDTDVPFAPQPGEDLVARGIETYGAREYAKAVGYWQAEVDARPQRAWTQYMLALSLWKDGRADEAAVAMEASIGADPTSVKSFVNLARIQNDRGDFIAALEAAEAAVALDADDVSGRFLVARSLFNLDRIDDAELQLVNCLATDPDHGHAQNLLGLVFMRQERDLEAIAAFEKASEALPGSAFVRNNLGMALELSGERSAAIASYRTAIELDPSHSRATSNLARLQPGELDAQTVASTEPIVEPTVSVDVEADSSDGTAVGSGITVAVATGDESGDPRP